MPGFIQQYREQIAIGILAAYVLYLGSGGFFKSLAGLGPIVSGMFSWTTTSTASTPLPAPTAVDEDAADYAALKRLSTRAERRNCPECKAAVKQFFAHWLDGEAV